MYDYIIVDTSPIGTVADAFLLYKFADVKLFIVRQAYTYREAFQNTIKNIENKNLNNLAILFNDYKVRKNSYKYAYQYAYYKEDNVLICELIETGR